MDADGRDCSLLSDLRQGLILVGVRTRTELHRQGHRIERRHRSRACAAPAHGAPRQTLRSNRRRKPLTHHLVYPIGGLDRRKEPPPRLHVTLVHNFCGSFLGPRRRLRSGRAGFRQSQSLLKPKLVLKSPETPGKRRFRPKLAARPKLVLNSS